MPGPSPAVSVIVPAYCRPKWLPLCLESVFSQDLREPYEVVVATDHASGLADELVQRYPRLRVAFCQPKDGPGGARNRGITTATGQYLAFCDADCVPARDWLRTLLGTCRRLGGRPVCGYLETAYPECSTSRADNMVLQGTARPRRCRVTHGILGASLCVQGSLMSECKAAFAEGVSGGEELSVMASVCARTGLPVIEPAALSAHRREGGLRRATAHQYSAGVGSGRVRRSLAVRGSFLARHLWLAPLLVPGRLVLIGGRCAREGAPAALDFLRLSPIIVCLLTAYAAGFVQGARAGPLPDAARRG